MRCPGGCLHQPVEHTAYDNHPPVLHKTEVDSDVSHRNHSKRPEPGHPVGEYQWVELNRLRIVDVHPRWCLPEEVPSEPAEVESAAVAVVRAYRDHLRAGHETLPVEALRVRPAPGAPGYYEVWDGALRYTALKLAGRELALVAVEDLSDTELCRRMLRATNRASLSPLELGVFMKSVTVKGSKLGLSRAACAREIGKSDEYVRQLCAAAEVAEQSQVDLRLLEDKAQHLAAIHDEAPSKEHWPTLTRCVVDEGWTAKQTRSHVRKAARGGKDIGPGPKPRNPLTCAGEVILLGDHRLLCGDAANAEDVRRLMAGEKADAMWSDCPWGVRYTGKNQAALRIPNDTPDDAPVLLADTLVVAADEALRPGAPYYLVRPSGKLAIYLGLAVLDAGFGIHEDLVWAKDHFVIGHSDYHYRHETMFYGFSPGGSGAGRFGPGRSGWFGGDDQDTLFEVARPKASPEHPTTKPVQLIEANLLNSTRRDHRVYDPFCGSGSVLIACERLGRRALAMEIDRRYCDVICARYQLEMGVMPVVEDSGEERDYLGSDGKIA